MSATSTMAMCVSGGVSACCGCNGDVCSRWSVCVMEGGRGEELCVARARD